MSELDIVERLKRTAGSRGLILGIGDDAAILRPRPGEDLVFTTDFLIEDVHFTRAFFTAPEAGHKALARSLSDLAAMGAEPRFALLSLAIPKGVNTRWLDGFLKGFFDLAKQTRTTLAGGDLSQGPVVIADVMACGAVPEGKALRRDGARPGDVFYVSGPLGRGWKKNRKPEPRLATGRSLIGKATACMDVSDGLSIDLRRMCLASGVAAALDTVPLARGATLNDALAAGEDYELLFAMPPLASSRVTRIPQGCLRIGQVTEGRAGHITLLGKPLPKGGWDHF